jgi:uncharacterized protein
MYKQVYLHPVRRAYDIHLIDFLKGWLPNGRFSTKLDKHIGLTDAEVLAALHKSCAAPKCSNYTHAKRIQCRDHYRFFYLVSPTDKQGGKLVPGRTIAAAAAEHFGKPAIRYDYMPPKMSAPNFPVRRYDGLIESSLKKSLILQNMPPVEVDTVYCERSILADAIKWKQENVQKLLGLK